MWMLTTTMTIIGRETEGNGDVTSASRPEIVVVATMTTDILGTDGVAAHHEIAMNAPMTQNRIGIEIEIVAGPGHEITGGNVQH